MSKYLHTLKIKPFLANTCILYPLENTKISKVFDILGGGNYKIDFWALTRNGLGRYSILLTMRLVNAYILSSIPSFVNSLGIFGGGFLMEQKQ